MHIQFLRGDTDENNRLVLPEGYLTVDLEKKSIRIHDGITPGGYEAVGVRAYEPPPIPGPQEPVAVDEEDGVIFYGETEPGELWSSAELRLEVGLSAGNDLHAEDRWLKFGLDDKIIYIAKVPFANSIHWDELNGAGLVYGERQLSRTEHTFKIRLPYGSAVNPVPASGFTGGAVNPAFTHGSEWNRTFYRIVRDYDFPTGVVNWGLYDSIELGQPLNMNQSVGGVNWCRESVSTGGGRRLCRYRGAVYDPWGNNKSTQRGWRPVLELIPQQ